MNKDGHLIFEAYLEEKNKIAIVALAMMCALGLGGCQSVDRQQRLDKLDPWLELLEGLAPLFSGLNDEQRNTLHHEIQIQLQQGEPSEGWKAWLTARRKEQI
tara:strand:+ start:264 stop:569 length:306 start_codon:yes stop_codon:yes gene_type:complete